MNRFTSRFGFLVFSCIFFSQICYGQLSVFNLEVAATNETCTANGSLSFIATDTAAGAIVLYRIYKLPDLVTPVAVTNTNTLSGLTAGTYRVEAIQSLGNLSNTQQQDIVITGLIVPLMYQVLGVRPPYCGVPGNVTVNVTQGNPVSYEIISGPVIVPPQASGFFDGMPSGEYVIRVNDACGDGVVQTHFLPPTQPNLSLELEQDCGLLDCNRKLVDVSVLAATGTEIVYPIMVELTIFPPNAPPIVQIQTINSGNAYTALLNFAIAFYDIPVNQVNIKVTDQCGFITRLNNIVLDTAPELDLNGESTGCNPQGIDISVCNLVPPYMIEFLSAPAGFIPGNFNPLNLGPFTQTPISYTSTVANPMPNGDYTIKITDACGRTAQGEVEFVNKATDYVVIQEFVSCDEKVFGLLIPNVGIPIVTAILTSAPPTYPHTLPQDLSSSIVNGHYSMYPILPGFYVFTGINECGDPYTLEIDVHEQEPKLGVDGAVLSSCAVSTGTIKLALTLIPIASVVMVEAPPGFNHPLPYDVSQYIHNYFYCSVPGLTVGAYTFLVTDICGVVYPLIIGQVTVEIEDLPPTLQFLTGCTAGLGSMQMDSANSKYVQVIITAAPPAFNHPLPYDVSFNISLGHFYMNTLPQGSYTFHTKDICNLEQNVDVVVQGNNVTRNDINIIANCGSFNLFMDHAEAQPYLRTFWLQKFNPVTQQWEHPLTGVPYIDGTEPTDVTSYRLVNSTINYNIATYGSFRILKYNLIFSNGNPSHTRCYTVIKEFEFIEELKINSLNAITCGNGSAEVFITVAGVPPYIYKITIKDHLPFLVENGNSNIFTGLAPGIYNFYVEDVCGNIVNREVDITTLSEPEIVADNLCVGQNAQLSAPAVSFLSYQWWKDNNTATILSTTHILNLNPFSNTTTPGIYTVRIYSTSNLSCIDKTITYTVPVIVFPNAGPDGVKTICGDTSPIDLFSLLGAPFDADGIWEETTHSGALAGSVWSPAGIAFGSYTFRYKISRDCSLNDEALVTIHFILAPEDPVITVNPNFCTSQTIRFNVDTIPGASYHWTGPNGFTSNEQNPTIENSSAVNGGLYTVSATINDCAAETSVELMLQPTPDFAIKPACIDNVFTISVVPNENSFEPENASYSWTGPNGFTSTENQITGLVPGLYVVTVTNQEGCPETHSIPVYDTVCPVSNVVTPNGDGNNENFNLTGLDVNRIEIYNRWGRLVYEQNNYTNQWHGQNMHNGELPDSTYYYILYLKSGVEKQGWVYKFSWKN